MLALLMPLTTDCRLPSPMFTLLAAKVPARRPPDMVTDIEPPVSLARLATWPARTSLTLTVAPLSALSTPSVPVTAAPADRPSAPLVAADPPLIWRLWALPSLVVLTSSEPVLSTVTLRAPLEAVCTAEANWLWVYVPEAMVNVLATPSMVTSRLLLVPSIVVDALTGEPVTLAPAEDWVTTTLWEPSVKPDPATDPMP